MRGKNDPKNICSKNLPELACIFDFVLFSSQRREIKSVASSIMYNRLKTYQFHRLISYF